MDDAASATSRRAPRAASGSAPRPVRTRTVDFDFVSDVLLWVLIISSTTIGLAVLAPTTDLSDDRSGLTHYYSVAMAVAGFALFALILLERLNRKSDQTTVYRGALLALIPYIGIALYSNTYSYDPPQTLNSCVRLLAFLSAMLAYGSTRGPASYVRVIARVLCFINVSSMLVAILIPSIGVHETIDVGGYAHVGDWKGITPHKNVLGPYASVGALLTLLYPHVTGIKGGWRYFIGGCCLLNMLMAQSSSALVTFVACIIFYFTIFYGRVSVSRTLVGILALLVGVGAAYGLSQIILTLLGKDSNLSGRTAIWDFALGKIALKPYLGYGFDASTGFFRDEMQKHLFAQAVDAHNGYLQIMLDLGVIGLGCFLFGAISSIIRGGLLSGGQGGLTTSANQALALCILWSLMAGFTEIGPMCLPSPLSFISFGAIACIGAVPRLRRRAVASARRAPPL